MFPRRTSSRHCSRVFPVSSTQIRTCSSMPAGYTSSVGPGVAEAGVVTVPVYSDQALSPVDAILEQ